MFWVAPKVAGILANEQNILGTQSAVHQKTMSLLEVERAAEKK